MTGATGGERPLPDVAHQQEETPPGVTRFDTICGPGVLETTERLVRRWGRDRALPVWAEDRLCLLSSAAVAHGLLFRPRAVTVTLQWADLDRVRVDVRWHGCAGAAPGTVSRNALDSTVAIFDAVAESWGFGPGSRLWQWMILDTDD
jgi:hypothetical protein